MKTVAKTILVLALLVPQIVLAQGNLGNGSAIRASVHKKRTLPPDFFHRPFRISQTVQAAYPNLGFRLLPKATAEALWQV